MEFKELILKRRSCRKYDENDISKEEIEEIIQTVVYAPSWKNSETGRYYVAISKEAKKEVYECLPDFNKNSSLNASYIIATFKKGISGYVNNKAEEAGDIWGGYDLGLQNAYLCLKATDLGYDTLIMGLRDEKRLRKYFNIPDDEIMLPVIAIGKKADNLTLKPRKELNEILIIK